MGLRIFFVLGEGEVRIDDPALCPGGTVSREKVLPVSLNKAEPAIESWNL